MVDHDPATLSATTRHLEALGNAVTALEDASAGIAHAASGQVDVALYELMMPSLDGHGFLDALRSTGSALPVVLMAHQPTAEEVVRGFRCGAVDFLLKPFHRVDLEALLGRLAERARLAEDAASGEASGPAPVGRYKPDDYRNLRQQMFHAINSGSLVLPVPASILTRVTTLANQNDPDAEEAIRTIESEVLLSRAVFKLAQSPNFRGRRPPASVREAIARTGVIRALANAATAAQRANYAFKDPGLARLSNLVWLNHFVVATTAEVIGERLRLKRPDRLQTMALFSEVGELMMLRLAAERWPELIAAEGPAPIFARLISENRARVSAMLLADWGVPAEFMGVARWVPPTPLHSVSPEVRTSLATIVLARELASGLLGENPLGRRTAPSEEDLRLLPSFEPDVEAEIRREALERTRSQLGVTVAPGSMAAESIERTPTGGSGGDKPT